MYVNWKLVVTFTGYNNSPYSEASKEIAKARVYRPWTEIGLF